jgi:hypothetical protein
LVVNGTRDGDKLSQGSFSSVEGWRMYPFSEFDLPDEEKPEALVEEKKKITALVPRWLKSPLEVLLLTGPRTRHSDAEWKNKAERN